MAKKIITASLLFVCIAILALVFAGENTQKPENPPAASEPNQPTNTQKEKQVQPDPPAAAKPSAAANDNSLIEDDQSELPEESPLPALYTACQVVFGQYVKDNGDVDYALLRRKRSDLFNTLKILETVHPAQIMAMNDAEKQAFWINAYNLCTLKLIVDNYPIEPKWYMILYPNNSIMQISNPWTKNYFKIQGLEYNLQEIERELLLERFHDPRICFALSNATRGGAFLRKEPYRAQNLNEQLDEQVHIYLASPRGLKWDNENRTLYISNLFNIYRDVFLKSSYAEIKKFRHRREDEKVWLNFLNAYLSPEQNKLLETTDYTLRFIDYNWNLNEFSSP
jgi:hypothetical protein